LTWSATKIIKLAIPTSSNAVFNITSDISFHHSSLRIYQEKAILNMGDFEFTQFLVHNTGSNLYNTKNLVEIIIS